MRKSWRHRRPLRLLGKVEFAIRCILLLPAAASAQESSADGGAVASDTADAMPEVADLSSDELAILKARVKSLEDRLAQQDRAGEELRKESTATAEKVKALAEAIQFSGFFDVLASTYKDNPNVFELGSFEFDIKKEFNKYFQVGAALVFADQQADLAVGFIDFHLFGGLIPARGNVFLESGFHLQIGKFDIPFGSDWQYFASLDRSSITAPLTTETLMEGGYNDVGVRVFGNRSFVNYAGYVLKGIEQGVALGGRLALVPFNNPFTLNAMAAQPLDVGFSYLHDVSQSGRTEQRTWAVDLEARYEFLRLQSEYYRRRDLIKEVTLAGYQISLYSSFLEGSVLPFGLYARYDQVREATVDKTEDQLLRRATFGAYAKPFEVTILKVEYSDTFSGNEDRHGRSLLGQLVIGFK